jgi:DNA (cytosine-5)-methyltransferase 1
MTVGSLFSGIGGLDLGFERAGFRVLWQCEADAYCRRVLARHWPGVPCFEDVRDVTAGRAEPVDVIIGGFPCQDISYAGYGAGLGGERSGLWWEFARVVRELGPRGVAVENVAALLSRGLGDVLGTFASLGFDAEWSSVSGCSVGAPHMRQRVFVVAHANGVDGWPRLRHPAPQADGSLQALNRPAGPRARYRARLANPSELYRGADGVPYRLERNRAIGNAVMPDVAEVVARRMAALLMQEAA